MDVERRIGVIELIRAGMLCSSQFRKLIPDWERGVIFLASISVFLKVKVKRTSYVVEFHSKYMLIIKVLLSSPNLQYLQGK